MTTLVLGSGAREHALGWALARDRGERLLFAPGNAGTAVLGDAVRGLDPADPAAVAEAARSHGVDLVLVGPEEPLARGVADRLRDEGIPVFGPSREAARLETSKAFAKAFMRRHGVPAAESETFGDFDAFRRYVEGRRVPLVIKKSGLAAGKGVLVADELPAMLSFGGAVLQSDEVLVEDRLQGFELSVFLLMDGQSFLLLPACADHKKAFDGDTGPNTGGMGAICPVPAVTEALWRRIVEETVEPTVRGLRAEGLLYRGVLFLGLMVTPAGCRVLEYNVRFGDPETQVLLPCLDIDWAKLFHRAAAGRLEGLHVPPPARSCVGVVVAAEGYPGDYRKGTPVSEPPSPPAGGLLFHAATARGADGVLRTGGGRCFTAVGCGNTLPEARERAYAASRLISFEGAWSRSDIGSSHLGC